MATKTTFTAQLANEGFTGRTYSDSSPVHQVLKQLANELAAVAESLDCLEDEDFVHHLRSVERLMPDIDGMWVWDALQQCSRDLKQLFRALDQDSEAPALTARYPLHGLHKSVASKPSSQLTYEGRARLLSGVSSYLTESASKLGSFVLMSDPRDSSYSQS